MDIEDNAEHKPDETPQLEAGQEQAADAPKEQSVLDAVDAALDDFNGVEKDDATGNESATDGNEDAPTDGEQVAAGEPAQDSAADALENDDEDDLTVEPEGLSERASARFKKLVERGNSYEQQRDQSNQQVDAIKQAMQGSNATADDMGSFLELTRRTKSSSMDDKRAALAMMDKQRNELALMVNDASASSSVLDAYPDLKESVGSMDMEEAQAMEIARGRHIQQQQQDQQQARQNQEQQSAATEVEQQSAIQQVVAMEQQWKANDIDYKAKEALVLPQMEHIRNTLPPSQWAAATQLAYNSVSQTMAAQKPQQRSPSPISGAGITGSPVGKPKTVMEAVEAALAGME
ncbi:MAG: hypothetical protein R8M45_05740 [Ghiorsea sp.]